VCCFNGELPPRTLAQVLHISQMVCTLSQKNVPPLTCYSLDIHDPITIIFGRSVTEKVIISDIAIFVLKRDVKLQLTTEKVRNQVMLCFPTSPVYWFCTTLRNTKPRNRIFSLKHCMLLCQRTHKAHLNYHLVAVESPFIPKVINCMHQRIKNLLVPRKRA